ncbi:12595_t:CDS:2, partial [Funneliformis caledonium]
QNLFISELCLPNIDQANIVENSIITSDKRVKNRKLRSMIHKPIKKVRKKDDLYTLIKRNRKETKEAEHESERILTTNHCVIVFSKPTTFY